MASISCAPLAQPEADLSATITGVLARNGSSDACAPALSLANNVAIDIDACGQQLSGTAVNIADKIAAKVPKPSGISRQLMGSAAAV